MDEVKVVLLLRREASFEGITKSSPRALTQVAAQLDSPVAQQEHILIDQDVKENQKQIMQPTALGYYVFACFVWVGFF